MSDGIYFYLCLLLLSYLIFQHRDGFLKLIYDIWNIITPFSDSQERDIHNAARAFAHYSILASHDLHRMRHTYGTMSWRHRQIGYQLGYTHKLARLEETININSSLTKQIADTAGFPSKTLSTGNLPKTSIDQVREVLKQIVREWSLEGAEERAQTFSPILDTLTKAVPRELRKGTTVLVPGAGLARLAWEISNLGFCTTSNEMSPYMNLAFRFLSSKSKTSRIDQHTMFPYAYWFSHQRSNEFLFRPVSFPDALPSFYPETTLHHEESDFLKILPKGGGYAYIITHYFIDTSYNIIATLQKIHSLLKPGGVWINLGPLLWLNTRTTMELSLEEVLELSNIIGFDVDAESRTSIPSEYTRDGTAMISWIYKAEFWIAKKK